VRRTGTPMVAGAARVKQDAKTARDRNVGRDSEDGEWEHPVLMVILVSEHTFRPLGDHKRSGL
jgi:hypothetical protein